MKIKKYKKIQSTLIIMFVIINVLWFIFSYVGTIATVSHGSMEKTLFSGDKIWVDKWSYLFKTPKKKDIIIFKSIEDKNLILIKRISKIIHKGDTVHISKNNIKLLQKIITMDREFSSSVDGDFKTQEKVDFYCPKHNYYYVLGDNSSVSKDSRHFGYIPEKNIIGKLGFILP